MIVAALSILAGLYFFRKQQVPFDELINLVRAEWIAGISQDYKQNCTNSFHRDLIWIADQLQEARRIGPLSHDASALLNEQLFLSRNFLRDTNRLRAALLTRLLLSVFIVIVIRTLRSPEEAMFIFDLALQCGASAFLVIMMWVTSRDLERSGVWQQTLSAEGKLWMKGVILDQHPHPEFQVLKHAERRVGASLREERIKWLRHSVSENAVANITTQSKLQILMTMFDLLVLGSLLVGGGLFPLLTLI